MTDFNLIPAGRREAKQRRARTRAWVVACAAYTAVLLAGYALCYATWGGQDAALADELTRAAARTVNWDHQIDMLQLKVRQARLTLEGNRTVGDQPDWSVVLALLAGNLDDDLVLKRCRLLPDTGRDGVTRASTPPATVTTEPTRFALELNGYGRSQKAISQFALRLERTGLFSKVTLLETNREPFLTGMAMAFRVKCLLGQKDRTKP